MTLFKWNVNIIKHYCNIIITMDNINCYGCATRRLQNKVFDKTENEDLVFNESMTHSDDIEEFLHRLIPDSIFLGCFPRDQFPVRELQFKKFAICILNIDESHQPGSHFVVIIRDGKKVLYFDSLALQHNFNLIKTPLYEIKRSIENCNFWVNHKQIQNMDSNSCGYYCIWFILKYYFFRPNIQNINSLFLSDLTLSTKENKNDSRIAKDIFFQIERIKTKEHMKQVAEKYGVPNNYDFNTFEKCEIYYK